MKLPPPISYSETESGSEEKEEKRDEIQRLLRDVRPADLVLVTKVDRWSRDILFTIANVREILRKGAKFWSITENFDAATPEGEMQLAMWASIAQMERERIKERTVGNRKRLRALGKFVEGLPPIGYTRARGKDAFDRPRRLEVDAEKAPIVREIFAMCVDGHSAVAISRHLRVKYPGVGVFGPAYVLQVLKNRVYTGQMAKTAVRPNKGRGSGQLPAEWVDAHEPIVDLHTWSTAQTALVSRRTSGARPKVGSSTQDWLIRSLARCAICGAVISPVPACKGSKLVHAGYYVCRRRVSYMNGEIRCSRGPYMRKDETDRTVEKALLKHTKSAFGALLRPPAPTKNAPNFEHQREQIREARARVVTLVSGGLMKMEDVKGEVAKLDERLSEIDAAEMDFTLQRGTDTEANRKGAHAWLTKAVEAWETLSGSVRRDILAAMSERITIGEDAQPMIAWADAPVLAARFAEGKLPKIEAAAAETPGGADVTGEPGTSGAIERATPKPKQRRAKKEPAAAQFGADGT